MFTRSIRDGASNRNKVAAEMTLTGMPVPPATSFPLPEFFPFERMMPVPSTSEVAAKQICDLSSPNLWRLPVSIGFSVGCGDVAPVD